MKILMIVTWFSPKDAETLSAGVFHYEQSMALKPYCETALYYPYDENLDTDFCMGEERGLLTFRRRMSTSRIGRWLNYVADFKKICEVYKPDIIHAHCANGAGVPATLLGKLFHIPVVVTEHNPMELFGLDRWSVRQITRWVYHNSRCNICVSPDSMERISKYFPDEDFRVIYNGIMNPASVKETKTIYRRDGVVNACIVAAFYDKEIKGYQYLLPALRRAIDEGAAIVLHICGGGTYQEYYEKMAEELGLTDHVIFYGQQNRETIYQIVRQMDFNISSSIFECSGVSVQEAELLGRPMLVTRSGGANSLIYPEGSIVVDRESVEALSDGILTMIKRLPEFDTDAIYSYAYENFEIDQVSRRYMAVYEDIMKL